MTDQSFDQHLSQIATRWSVVFAAHEGGAEAPSAQRGLLERYQRAAYRYLLGCTRSQEAADELFQELALRVVRGDFRRVSPEKGRFRDYLKQVLRRLIVDRHRAAATRPTTSEWNPATEPRDLSAPDEPDEDFVAIWRAELLQRAWDELEAFERATAQPLHTVLRHRTDHPDAKSPEMAEALAAKLGSPVDAGWVRKRLHQAREKFTDFIVAEVARSLERPSVEGLELELIDLGLHEQCRAAAERWGRRDC